MSLTEPKILLIEGKRADHPVFHDNLKKKGFEVELVSSGTEGLAAITAQKPAMVIVNAASMRTSGRRICRSVHAYDAHLPVILIVDAENNTSNSFDAEVVLRQPFTLQKLINRIRLLAPLQRDNLITVGPIQFDSENHWVRCHEKQTSLTPRLSELLNALIERPGEIIERKELFKRVWETTYLGDTRTMDVHISWLRHAIEEDPRHPQYIKTVRGIGYRLDIRP